MTREEAKKTSSMKPSTSPSPPSAPSAGSRWKRCGVSGLSRIGRIAQAVLYVHNVDLRRITMSITEFKIHICFVRAAWLP